MWIFQLLALAGLIVCLYGIYLRYTEVKHRLLPTDGSPVKGNLFQGTVYAFTQGMMPWEKEATRIHMMAYLRGIGFHVAIFIAMSEVIISPFWKYLPPFHSLFLCWVLIVGAFLGVRGATLRITERNLRGLSLPDDHFAIWLVSLFVAVTGFAMINDAFLIPMYLMSAITFVYIPLGKIRHCLYFFFSRIFFGKFFGRRAVFPHPEAMK